MAIVLTIGLYLLLPLLWRGVALAPRILVAAVAVQVIMRYFPALLGLLQGALMLAVIAGALMVMVGGLSRR